MTKITTVRREQEKYENMWALPAYSNFSPGQQYAEVFSEQFESNHSVPIIDLGCGKGEGGKRLRELGFSNVTFLDIVDIGALSPFYQQSLWDRIPPPNLAVVPSDGADPKYRWGFCCDVMEHIPTEYVALCIHQIASACEQGFFSIGLHDDGFGSAIGDTLHLTVRPFEWWRNLLSEFGTVIDARDLHNTGLYHVTFG